MSAELDVEYISNAEGKPVAVVVPIDLWQEISSERETAHLLSTPANKKRLLEAMNRTGGMSLEEVRAKLGI